MNQEPVCQECGWIGQTDFKDGKTVLSCERCNNTWIPAYFKKIDDNFKNQRRCSNCGTPFNEVINSDDLCSPDPIPECWKNGKENGLCIRCCKCHSKKTDKDSKSQ